MFVGWFVVKFQLNTGVDPFVSDWLVRLGP
jgi:hypothetical protein